MAKERLRHVLRVEGVAQTWQEVPREICQDALDIGYEAGLSLVINMYKPAAKERVAPAGENTNERSVVKFRAFARACEALAADATRPTVARALLLHDAASALSRMNGNTPFMQKIHNLNAMELLESIPPQHRDDDWWCVWEKVVVGLMENGHKDFDPALYEDVIESMEAHHSKDTAGRRAYMARWHEQQGDLARAIAVLEPVERDGYSAPNQRDLAITLLAELRLRVAPRESAAQGQGGDATRAGDADGDSSDSGDLYPTSRGASEVGAISALRLKEGLSCGIKPHPHDNLQKNIS